MTEKTGLEAVFETKEFQAGLEIYKKGLADAQQITDKTAGGISSSGDQVGGLTAALGGISPAALLAGGALVSLGATVISSIINVFKEAITTVKDFVGESIQIASRWQELDMVAQLLGQQMGLTSEEVHNLSAAMQEAGVRGDVASKTIAGLVRMKMDPSLGLELGKAAQNLAILAQDGADSSEVLDRLMLGIQRLSPIILRTAGANVDLNTAYQDFAATMGIVGRELTQVEKQQAAYNAVLESASTVAGAYEVSMESAGKQMRSLTGREIPTLQSALGAPFQGAFLNVASAARSVVQTFTEAIQEGGALYPVMVNLGAIADIITEALGNLAKNGAQAVVDFFTWLANIFTGGASDAFDWGFELVVQFAQGIINAAASVLVSAINYLGSILAGWLAPGSPPKVAPDIIKWGTGAMTEYLKGFTQADFASLRNIASPLKSALDIMVQAGDATKKEVAKIFLSLNEDISQALSTGNADESLFERIAKEAGEFGKEIADLARGEFALAKASDEVAQAQERVNEAIEKQQGAEKAVRDLTSEYNSLLRAGASDEILKAKLAEINAAEEAAILAGEERKSAEEGLAEKEDALAILQEQVKLQQELVKQLLDLAKAAILPGEALPTAGAGGVAGIEDGAIGGGGFEIDTEAIKNAMSLAVETAKAVFLEKWEIFKGDVKKAFDDAFGPAIKNIETAWNNFMNIAKQFYDEKLKPVFDDIKLWAETNLPLAWQALLDAASAVWSWTQENLIPVFESVWQILKDIADIIAADVSLQFQVMKGQLDELFRQFEEIYIPWLISLWENLGLTIDASNLWSDVLTVIEKGLKLVNDKLIIFHDWLLKVRDAILNIPKLPDLTKNSPVPLAEGLKLINAQMSVFTRNLSAMRNQMSGLQASAIINPAMSSQSIINQPSNRIFNLEQNNTIQSPMDMATFRAMFNQVVREQFAGA